MRSDLTKDFPSLRRFSRRLSSRNLAVRVFNLASNARSAAVGRSIFGVRSDCSIRWRCCRNRCAEIFCALGCGAVSDFLSSRIVAWRHRRGAVAVVRMARDRVLSRAGACPVDDRRPNGLVHYWIPWDCWSAPAGCVTAARCRNLCARCAPNRERFSASHAKTNSRRHRLSRIALVVSSA